MKEAKFCFLGIENFYNRSQPPLPPHQSPACARPRLYKKTRIMGNHSLGNVNLRFLSAIARVYLHFTQKWAVYQGKYWNGYKVWIFLILLGILGGKADVRFVFPKGLLMFDLLQSPKVMITSDQLKVIFLFIFQTGISQMDISWQRYSLGIFHRKLKCILTITEHHYLADRETGLNFRGLVSLLIIQLRQNLIYHVYLAKSCGYSLNS